MGFNNTATTVTLTAKLTPTGRIKLFKTNNNLVSSFSLGDSDANYYAALPLTSGEVPSNGGNIGPFQSTTNSVAQNVGIKSYLIVNNSGTYKKAVEPESNNIILDYVSNGSLVISGTNITQRLINRNNYNTDEFVNLFYSFNLPLNSNGDYNFTGLTSAFGGYSDTALSGIAQSKVVIVALDNSKYGELIDGKTIKVVTTTSAATYTMYSTYQDTGVAKTQQDASYTDTATNTSTFGKNIAFLFSDNIKKPNGDTSLSWSTGYGTVKPFSVNGKQLFNLTTNSNISKTADTAVGIAFLDKGFIVLTHPNIVNQFNTASTTTVVTCDSISSSVSQSITCICGRGEFGTSTNTTFTSSDTPRISEVGLYDTDGDLIAIAKTDKHLIKNVNEFFALGIKISI